MTQSPISGCEPNLLLEGEERRGERERAALKVQLVLRLLQSVQLMQAKSREEREERGGEEDEASSSGAGTGSERRTERETAG